MPRKKQPDRYAFWRYDQFPYWVGGKITSEPRKKDGKVQVEGYGLYWWQPRIVLEGNQGKAALRKLQKMKEGYGSAAYDLKSKWKQQLFAELPQFEVPF